MAERPGRWGWVLVLVLCAIGAGTWFATRQSEVAGPSPSDGIEAPQELRAPEPRAGATEAGGSSPSPRRAPPAPVRGGAPPGCPDDDSDPPALVRPSIWDLLSVRTQELRDRLPQLSRDASPALRDGLNGLGGDDPAGAIERLREAPDRDREGFDIAVAAMLHLGMRALAEEDPGTAEAWASQARQESPDDPLTHALAALVALHQGRLSEGAERVAAASALDPAEPGIALQHARGQARVGRFGDARAAAERYLREYPEDTRVAAWRDRIASREDLTRHHARRTYLGITVYWPDRSVAVRRVDELTRTVRETLTEVASRSGTEARQQLVVVIYEAREEMQRATCAPSWSGGVFDGVLHLHAGSVNRPRFLRTVRHEATHAQLAVVRGRIPSWLNEGFAQAMEGPERIREAATTWDRMVRREYWIPFASLEGALIEIGDADDAGLAYHQSLAMYLYLEDRGRVEGVREAFREIERGQSADLLSRLVPQTDGRALLADMARRVDAVR